MPQSHVSRRDVLGALSGGAAAAALGSLTPLPARAAPPAAPLPPWAYGGSSTSTETVLMFRGNPAHTFYGTGPLPEAPQLKWKVPMPGFDSSVRGVPQHWAGTGWTGTAVKLGDYVYVGSPGRAVYCLEAATGRIAWKYMAGAMYKGSPCLYDNKLYIGNTDNLLRCMDAETGRAIWTHDTSNDLDSSPCVVDGRLYINGENGHARCLDPQTGQLIWKTFVGGIGPGTVPGSNGCETSPAIADGELYGVTYVGDLFCLDSVTGAKKWVAQTGDDTDASPVISGEFVYAAAEEKSSHLFCFARADGREVWRFSANTKGYWSTPAVVGDRIWVGGQDGKMHCLEAATGKPVWEFQTGEGIWCSPCVIDDRVVFGSRDAHIYMLEASTGREIWKHAVDGRIISSPCIVGGTIWIGTATGWFYCFGA